METVTDLVFWGSKITADGDCSHEIKRRLLLERKVMTNLDSILKSRDITLPAKVHLFKAMVFPIVSYGCVSWTIKKAEFQRIDAFGTVVLEKTLESPLDCKEIPLWGCQIVWCILTSRYLVSLLPATIIHVSDIFLVGFWSWEISFMMWGCRGWGWQAAGTWVSVSREMVVFPAPIGWPGASQSICTQ